VYSELKSIITVFLWSQTANSFTLYLPDYIGTSWTAKCSTIFVICLTSRAWNSRRKISCGTPLKIVIFIDECLSWEDTSFSGEVTAIKAEDSWVHFSTQVQYTDMWHPRKEHKVNKNKFWMEKWEGKKPLHTYSTDGKVILICIWEI
jgi:hypothetical protein